MSLLGRSNGFDASLERMQTALALAPPEAWFDRVQKRKIIVHLTTDQSVEGVLMEVVSDGLILRAAVLLGPGGARTEMRGETHIPRERIAFSQLDE